MSDLLAPNTTNLELALSQDFLDRLETPEDHLNAILQFDEEKNNRTWWSADIALNYYKKFLRPLDLARAGLTTNNSTIKYYLRTASAFSPEKRIPSVSFTHHFQASLADEWDSKTLKFVGEYRFVYLERAAEAQMSVAALKSVMEIEKQKRLQKVDKLPCVYCLKTDGEINTYSIYRSAPKKDPFFPLRLQLHDACFKQIGNQFYGI